MNRIFIKMLCVIALVGMIISQGCCIKAQREINVDAVNGVISSKQLQRALDQAGTDVNDLLVVNVAPGVCDIKMLTIRSNTILNANGVTFRHNFKGPGCMIQFGDSRATMAGGYTCCQNVQVNGGTFDAGTAYGNDVSTVCAMFHVQNITLNNVMMKYKPKKTDNAHLIEFGAAKDVVLNKCRFYGNQKVGEAVQLESARKEVKHSVLMGNYDNTKTYNVTVKGGLFDNFQYAYGTNHGCKKDSYSGMKVEKCTFQKIKKYAVCSYNYKLTLKNNVVKKSGKTSFASFVLKLGQKGKVFLKHNKVK